MIEEVCSEEGFAERSEQTRSNTCVHWGFILYRSVTHKLYGQGINFDRIETSTASTLALEILSSLSKPQAQTYLRLPKSQHLVLQAYIPHRINAPRLLEVPMMTWKLCATKFYFMLSCGKPADVCAIAMLHTISSFSIACHRVSAE